MVRLLLVAIVLIAAGVYFQQTRHNAPDAVTQAQAAPTQQQAVQPPPGVVPVTTADQIYLGSYMQRVGSNNRAYREGLTTQKLSLPSGAVVEVQIQKTNAGYCPRRRETLYNTTVSVPTQLMTVQGK